MSNDKLFTDIIAERALLSILFNNPKLYIDNMGLVTKADFSSETHAMVFDCFEKSFDNNPDSVDKFSIYTTAKELGYDTFGKLTDEGKYIDSLIIQKISPRNLEKLILKVKDLSIKRQLTIGVDEMAESLASSEADGKTAIDIISGFEQKVTGYLLSVGNSDEIKLLGTELMELMNDRADNPTANVGLCTGFPRFDAALGGGLRKGSVTLIGARPKNFKSGLALNIAKNISILGVNEGRQIPTLYLDTELQADYQKFRLTASLSGIPIDNLETGKWRSSALMVDSVEGAALKVENAPLYHVTVGGYGIDKIISLAKYWLTKIVGRDDEGNYNDCLIIYDYIKLMNGGEIKNDMKEYQVLGFHMTALHDFVTRYNVPLLCLSQLNRDGADCDDETVIAGADRLLWFASSFTILRNKKQEELETDGPNAGNMRMKTVMTRFGPGMDQGDYLCLRVNKACMNAQEFKYKSEFRPEEVEIGKEEAESDDEELNSPYD